VAEDSTGVSDTCEVIGLIERLGELGNDDKAYDICLDQVPSESGSSFMRLQGGKWIMRIFGDAKGEATAALLPYS
jgi:hypothetical protein